MNDTEYHAKILRLPIGREVETHREVMSEADTRELLTGHVYVTEKLDGRLTHIEYPDLRPKPSSVKSLYSVELLDYFYEDLRIRHSIYYNGLPDWVILLDIASGPDILSPDEVKDLERLSGPLGFKAPVIADLLDSTPDYFLAHLQDYLQRKPTWATSGLIEGLVVKNYDKQLFGKVVSFEFYRGIEESGNYLRRRVQEGNRLLLPFRNRER